MIEKIRFIKSVLWAFLAPFIRRLMTQAGQALAISAMKAVRVVHEKAMAGEKINKRDEAFQMILEDLKKQGIEMTSDAIHGAIGTAVIKLHDEQK